ncbi:MAG: hypothetical protein KDD55_03060 [Bdellovibrionales bacterium]|nr:hypothetical protein [Bdellovibrionales bacterium]
MDAQFQPPSNDPSPRRGDPAVEITRMRPFPALEVALALGELSQECGVRLDGLTSLYDANGMLRRAPTAEELQTLFAVGRLVEEEISGFSNRSLPVALKKDRAEILQGFPFLFSGDPQVDFRENGEAARLVSEFSSNLPTYYEQFPPEPFRKKALSFIQAANETVIELSQSTGEPEDALRRFLQVRLRANGIPQFLSPYSDREVEALARTVFEITCWLSEEEGVEEAGGLTCGEYKALLLEGVERYRIEVYPNLSYQGQVGRESEGVLLSPENGYTIARIAREAIALAGEEGVVPELGSAQYELNFPAQPLSGDVLSEWLKFEQGKLNAIERAAQAIGDGGIPVQIAIAPTIEQSDLRRVALGEGERWDRLDAAWQRALFEEIKRSGEVPALDGYVPESIAVSSSMSSSQLHIELPVDEREAAKVFNICMIATVPVLAASGASPFFLEGRRGGAEVRPQIWEKLDDLGRGRVFFGDGWIDSPFEVLEKYAEIERLDLKRDGNEDPLTLLRRQVDSVWPHFRLIPEQDHWRCENRVFSTEVPIDAIATAAFYFGLVRGLSDQLSPKDVKSSISFEAVREAFYGVCANGLEQEIPWIDIEGKNAKELILRDLMPIARRGLVDAGISMDDAERYLSIVEHRVSLNRTNGEWQKLAFRLSTGRTIEEKMKEVAARYMAGQMSGTPVSQWPEWSFD